jgi:hypothetical protein
LRAKEGDGRGLGRRASRGSSRSHLCYLSSLRPEGGKDRHEHEEEAWMLFATPRILSARTLLRSSEWRARAVPQRSTLSLSWRASLRPVSKRVHELSSCCCSRTTLSRLDTPLVALPNRSRGTSWGRLGGCFLLSTSSPHPPCGDGRPRCERIQAVFFSPPNIHRAASTRTSSVIRNHQVDDPVGRTMIINRRL